MLLLLPGALAAESTAVCTDSHAKAYVSGALRLAPRHKDSHPLPPEDSQM